MNDVVKKIIGEDFGKKVKFIVLYGSRSEHKETVLSDIDLAVYYDGSEKERFLFRVKISGILGRKYDIHMYQDLPLYVQKEVLKGRVLYNNDYSFSFGKFLQTIKDYDFFKKHLDLCYERINHDIAAS